MEKSTHTNEYALVRAELKAARECAQLSQRALAARLGTPHSWVAKVEAGERRVDLVEMCWIFAACGVDPVSALEQLGRKLTPLKSKTLRVHQRKP